MSWFSKVKKVEGRGPMAEVVEVSVRVLTEFGEYTQRVDLPTGSKKLFPGDAIQFTWNWNGIIGFNK